MSVTGSRPSRAVEAGIRRAQPTFGAPEVRQHVGVAPAAVAALRPGVEIGALAAIVDHAVERARSAEHASLRGRDAPPAAAGGRLGGELPRVGGVEQHLDEAGRHVDERMPVRRPGFQHADRARRGLPSADVPAPTPRRRCRRSRSRTGPPHRPSRFPPKPSALRRAAMIHPERPQSPGSNSYRNRGNGRQGRVGEARRGGRTTAGQVRRHGGPPHRPGRSGCLPVRSPARPAS